MPENADIAPAKRLESFPIPFNPERNLGMRRVIVDTDTGIEPGLKIKQAGWTTETQGTKVDLQQIAEHNRQRFGRMKTYDNYERIYFTTQSGTIYCARSLADGTWEVEASNRPGRTVIKDKAILEIGQRFQSPQSLHGQLGLDTSLVQSITLVSLHGKPKEYGVSFSDATTDIGTRFAAAVRARGDKYR